MSDHDAFAMDFNADHLMPFRSQDFAYLSPINVYLASPLTHVDAALIAEISTLRRIIKDTFTRYDFHGARFEVYDPGTVTPPGTGHSSEDVYILDHKRTSMSDLVVFITIAPSLGVGMEAQIAAQYTLPRVMVGRTDTPVSRMFNGAPSATLAHIQYEHISGAAALVEDMLHQIAEAACESARRRRDFVEAYHNAEFGGRIIRARLIQNISRLSLANQTDIPEHWLEHIETDPSACCSASFLQTMRICEALGMIQKVSHSGAPDLALNELSELPNIERASLDALVEVARQPDDDGQLRDDAVIVTLWKEYTDFLAEEDAEKLVNRDETHNSHMESLDWITRYNRMIGRLF